MLHTESDQLRDIGGAGVQAVLPVLDGSEWDATKEYTELRLCKPCSVAEGSDCG